MEKLTFVTDDNENVELYIIEETRANGVNYLLVTDSKDKGAFKNNFILLCLLTRNYRLRQD